MLATVTTAAFGYLKFWSENWLLRGMMLWIALFILVPRTNRLSERNASKPRKVGRQRMAWRWWFKNTAALILCGLMTFNMWLLLRTKSDQGNWRTLVFVISHFWPAKEYSRDMWKIHLDLHPVLLHLPPTRLRASVLSYLRCMRQLNFPTRLRPFQLLI